MVVNLAFAPIWVNAFAPVFGTVTTCLLISMNRFLDIHRLCKFMAYKVLPVLVVERHTWIPVHVAFVVLEFDFFIVE